MNIRELKEALYEAFRWAEHEEQTLQDLHDYALIFDCDVGSNIFEFVLRDALAYRGMTLELFRENRFRKLAK